MCSVPSYFDGIIEFIANFLEKSEWSGIRGHASEKIPIIMAFIIELLFITTFNLHFHFTWHSSLVSTIHATTVSILCIYTLVMDEKIWVEPLTWFYRSIGYKPDRRRVCSVTLMFAILFAITRNFMIVPFWMIAYRAYLSPAYISTKLALPWLDIIFCSPPLILDCLNIYWASKTYRIGWKAAKSLWQADWQTDIRLARTGLQRRFRHIRHRKLSDSLDLTPPTILENEIPAPETVDAMIINEDLSSSTSSDENEFELSDASNNMDRTNVLPGSHPPPALLSEEPTNQIITHRTQ